MGRWALVRRVVQAPCDLLPNLVCPSAAQLRVKGSSVVGLHIGISVPPVLYPFWERLSIPSLAQPSPCCGGRQGCSTNPGTSQLSVAAAPARENKGVSTSKGGVPVPRPFAKEHPRALHPWAVPGEAVELLKAVSWEHHGSPFPGPHFPKSLEPTSF